MIINFENYQPKIADDVFLASGCKIIGNVKIQKKSSIWFNAVIRGDVARIKIGENTNIQENSSLHVDPSLPLNIKNNITVGHGAILHSCLIESNCLIGMGARILNKAKIGKNSIIGAGTVITENKEIPPNSLVLGVPGKIIREISKDEKKKISDSAREYYELALKHKKSTN